MPKSPSCFREFARYCSLNILGMAALSCYVLADTFFVANGLGPDGLAALNLAIPIYSFIQGCGLMLGMGGATRFSILRHQGRTGETDAVFSHTLVMAAVTAALFLLVGLFGADAVTALLGADEAVFAMTRTYIRVLCLFAPAYLLNDLLLCFVRNDGAPQRSMAAMVSGSFSNILLDYLFIFPMGMGIFGAVLATGLAAIISLAVLSPFFLRRQNTFRLCSCAPSPALAGAVLAAGVPSLVTEVSAGAVMVAFNAILLGLGGNLAVAAYGVVANLSLVVLAIYSGVAQGVQPLLSKYYGAGQPSRVRAVLRYAVITVLLLSLFFCLVLILGAEPLAALFNRDRDPALQAIAVQGLRLYFTGCPWAGLNIVLAVYFTATDCPRPGQVISLLRGFVLILPLAFLLSALWDMPGLWLTFPITEGLTALLAWALYLLRHRKG